MSVGEVLGSTRDVSSLAPGALAEGKDRLVIRAQDQESGDVGYCRDGFANRSEESSHLQRLLGMCRFPSATACLGFLVMVLLGSNGSRGLAK